MPGELLLSLAQLNPTVGDISGNLSRLRKARRQAAAEGSHLLMTSELYVSGYPPEDLVLKSSFQKAVHIAVEELARETSDGGPAILIGTPWHDNGKLYNAALLLSDGQIAAKAFKNDLPNYGPFDEKRVFTSAPLPEPIAFRGLTLGVMICEDMWTVGAASHLKKQGAQILLVPNGSPFESGKLRHRQTLARQRIAETGLSLVYVNQTGGQDELVFDGTSFVLDDSGKCQVQLEAWSEGVVTTKWSLASSALICSSGNVNSVAEDEAGVYHALMIGLRDYVEKNGFPGVILGLSGGIDSALVAVIAADALGADKLQAVMMPSPYTSPDSLEDAESVARALKCRFESIDIAAAMTAFAETLAQPFANRSRDTTEENIQSRCRGMILMALSNKFGAMVLSTGNKSEMSVGYTTLYGDLCGGFAVLKDLYKMQVYKLARWRNKYKPSSGLAPEGPVIAERIFAKAPTAELRPNQTDQDNLPPYEVLDDILECLIERDMGLNEISARGHGVAMIRRIWSMLDKAEYKRRQSPPGVKITSRTLSRERRYPITNGYKES